MKTVARALRAALTLYAPLDAAAAGDEEALSTLRLVLRDFRALHGTRFEVALDAYDEVSQAAILVASIASEAMPRQQVVASAVLQQVHDGYEYSVASTRPAFFLRAAIDDLVGLAHHMLAIAITNRVHVRVCRGCSTVFVPERTNQHYHDRACANRTRQQGHRARAPKELPDAVMLSSDTPDLMLSACPRSSSSSKCASTAPPAAQRRM